MTLTDKQRQEEAIYKKQRLISQYGTLGAEYEEKFDTGDVKHGVRPKKS